MMFYNEYEVAPCMGCKRREVGCHATCEAYKDWKARAAKHKAALRKAREKARILQDGRTYES